MPADMLYTVKTDGNVLVYPNPDSTAALAFVREQLAMFGQNLEMEDGAIWVEDRNWEDVRDNWLPSEDLTVAIRETQDDQSPNLGTTKGERCG